MNKLSAIIIWILFAILNIWMAILDSEFYYYIGLILVVYLSYFYFMHWVRLIGTQNETSGKVKG